MTSPTSSAITQNSYSRASGDLRSTGSTVTPVTKIRNDTEKLWAIQQKQPPEVFYKKGGLRNFTKFTLKQLCQSLFFNKVVGLGLHLY